MESSNKERNVYEHNVVVKIMEYKISAIDVHGKIYYSNLTLHADCVMIIGSDKGYIYPYDIMTDVKNKKVIYFTLKYLL